MRALLAFGIGFMLVGCAGDLVPPWMQVAVSIQPGGIAQPSIFSAPIDGVVTFANNDTVACDVDFDSPVSDSQSVQPGHRISFRMPGYDPGSPIGFRVSSANGGGSSGSVTLFASPSVH